MIDLIIPFHNGFELLRACLRAVEASGFREGRIILVDDASSPEVHDGVAGLTKRLSAETLLLRSETNRGFRDSVALGFEAGAHPYVLLLNSDTIPTPGFAGNLVAILEKYPKIQAVAPVSNVSADLYQYRPGFEALEPERPLLERIARFAAQMRQDHYGKVSAAPYLTAMCLAFGRDAFREVGGLPGDYIHGYFEDLDLSCRFREAGYELAIREDCFVYHKGHGSYGAADRAWLVPAIMNNYRQFSARWSHLPEHGDLVARIKFAGAAEPLKGQV